jgi:hypothetical protein
LVFSNSVVVEDSKTYSDTTLPISKRLRGIYIIDKENMVALIWDTMSKKTAVATLNFSTLSINYKPSLPIIYFM